MTSKLNNAIFGDVFDQVAPHYDSICNAYTIRRRQEFVQSFAKGTVLEVGSASGIICESLKNTCDVVACDISEKMCDEARKKGIRAVCCDAESLPFDACHFDTVIAPEVIYYFDHPDRFLTEISRVLKPKGQLLITMTSPLGLFGDRIRAILRNLGVSQMYFDDPIRPYLSLKRLVRLMRQCRFEDIHVSKMILFPHERLDRVNRFLESSWLKHFSLFVAVVAPKHKPGETRSTGGGLP